MLGGLRFERRAFDALDADAEALLELLPDRVGLGEQDVGVEREQPRVSALCGEQVDKHAFFLLERAGQRHAGVEAVKRPGDDLLSAQRFEIRRALRVESRVHTRKLANPDQD